MKILIRWLVVFTLLLSLSSPVYCADIAPTPKFTAMDVNGDPQVGAKLYTYESGTTTPKTTWVDEAKTTPNTNPIILDSYGQAEVWIDPSLGKYTFKLDSAEDVNLWTVDALGELADVMDAANMIYNYGETNSVDRTVEDRLQTTAFVSDWDGDLAQAIADLGSTVVNLVLAEPYVVPEGVTITIPSNVQLVFRLGGTISSTFGGSDETIAFSGTDPEVGVYEIFDSDLVIIGVKTVRPDWWGENTTPGTTDMTAEIQAAVDCVETGGGSALLSPAGVYFVSATITIDANDVSIIGENSVITRSGDYGDTVFFTGDDVTGTLLEDASISGITFKSTGLTTSGAHIHMNGVWKSSILNIKMEDGFKGFELDGYTAGVINDIYVVFADIFGGSETGRTMMEFGSAAATYAHPSSGDVFVSNFNLRGNLANTVTQYGIEIESSDGLWFSNGHIGNTTGSDLIINAVETETIGLLFFDNVMFDAAEGAGITFNGDTTIARNIQFVNSHIKGGGVGTYGVVINAGATVNNVQFTNCAISEWNKHGLVCDSEYAYNFTLANMQIRGNSYTVPDTYSGLRLNEGRYWNIVGGRIGGSNVSPTLATQEYGIVIANNFVYGTITGVDLRKNATSSIEITGGAKLLVGVFNILTEESFDLASAATLDLTIGKDFFNITGTTDVSSIVALIEGKKITLQFEDILTVADGTGNLRLAGDFTTTAKDTLSLVCDGVSWVEVSRSVN